MNKHVKNGGLCALALATLTINIAEAAPQKNRIGKGLIFSAMSKLLQMQVKST
ncbi:hypothetical protein [Shewanella sp. ENK2]|uniref:hypothetical protein n=1 Tax=Shewanella sp. ENK2 TaxID=2775245 RepID=UPI003748A908